MMFDLTLSLVRPPTWRRIDRVCGRVGRESLNSEFVSLRSTLVIAVGARKSSSVASRVVVVGPFLSQSLHLRTVPPVISRSGAEPCRTINQQAITK